METKPSAKNQSTSTERKHSTTGFVTSQDGTRIGYRRIGYGPGVVVVHGTMSSGYNHMQLAEQLSDAFTIYLIDRRSRDLSGPYSKEDYSIQEEVEDLDALLTKRAPIRSSGSAQEASSASRQHSPCPPFTKPPSTNHRRS